MRALRERPGFVDLHKSLELGLPEVRVLPDREKAASLGVDAASVATVVQASIGGIDVGKFKDAGHRYDIRMRLEARGARGSRPTSGACTCARATASVVELRNLIQRRDRGGAREDHAPRPPARRHHRREPRGPDRRRRDRARSARSARRILPEGVSISFSGSAEAFQESLAAVRPRDRALGAGDLHAAGRAVREPAASRSR